MGADMGRQASQVSEDSASRFEKYVGVLTSVVGHADRAASMHYYCVGLVAAEGRKSVEPMAAVTAPTGVSAQHQRLLHFVANAPWSDEQMLAKVGELVTPSLTRAGPIEAWIIDDTGIPKKGEHSVGVHHQYCGQLGKQANCQVAVTLSIANHHGSLPIAHRLYLPKEWIDDEERCEKAHVPPDIHFKTKPQIALEQIRAAMLAGVSPGVVLGDSGYGVNSTLRLTLMEWGLTYIVGITSALLVRPVQADDPETPRVNVKKLALSLPKRALRTVVWREGSNVTLRSRFARVRVRTAPSRGRAFAEETLLIEWPKDEAEPTKYWLANIDQHKLLAGLVDLAKLRWRIERDYEELKQEAGLGDYEGRGWRGFHHHATLAIAAYGFLVSESETIPPSGPRSATAIKKSPLPSGYRPRGAPDPSAAPCPNLDRYDPSRAGRRDCAPTSPIPALQAPQAAKTEMEFMTQ